MRIGDYQVIDELGRGGMGVVYRVRHLELGVDRALKLLPGKNANEHQVRRFEREVQTLARADKHPNVVRIHSVGVHDGSPYMVQDLVPGTPLDRLIEHGLEISEAVRIAHELALALGHLHSQGILHRDVKPENVLVGEDGRPILIDFGISKDAHAGHSHLTKTGRSVGSPGFWSPEQALGLKDEIGPASDVYALGATLFALLTGEPPFTGLGLHGHIVATAGRPADPPSHRRAEVDKALDAVVLRCLEKAPHDRYPTGSELAGDLARYRLGKPVEAGAAATRPWRLWGAIAALLALVTLAAALLAPRLPSSTSPRAAPIDDIAPVLSLSTPNWIVVMGPHVVLRGRVEDQSPATVTANGQSADCPAGGVFELRIPLRVAGRHDLRVSCIDSAGNVGTPINLVVLRAPDSSTGEALLAPYRVAEGYLVTDSLLIGPKQRVVLPPGTRVRFSESAAIICRGELWSAGKADQPVLLQPSGSHWQGILLEGRGALAAFAHTRLERAKVDHVLRAMSSSPGEDLGKVGGGITVLDGARVILSDSVISHCEVHGDNRGGGLHLEGGEAGESAVVATRTRFESCKAKQGGAIWVGPRASANLTECQLVENQAFSRGGGLVASQGSGELDLQRVLFLNNTADRLAGGAAFDRSAVLVDCLFQENSSHSCGGLMVRPYEGRPFQVRDSAFVGNEAVKLGGGAAFYEKSTLSSCRFQGNESLRGGGAAFGPGEFELEDCMFKDNHAAESGGGVFLLAQGGSVSLKNSSLVRNSAAERGGAIATEDADSPGKRAPNLGMVEPKFESNSAPAGCKVYLGTGTDPETLGIHGVGVVRAE